MVTEISQILAKMYLKISESQKKKYKQQREKEMKIYRLKMDAHIKKYGKKDFTLNKTRRRILMENMNLQKKVAKLEEKLEKKVTNIIHNNNQTINYNEKMKEMRTKKENETKNLKNTFNERIDEMRNKVKNELDLKMAYKKQLRAATAQYNQLNKELGRTENQVNTLKNKSFILQSQSQVSKASKKQKMKKPKNKKSKLRPIESEDDESDESDDEKPMKRKSKSRSQRGRKKKN